MIFGTKKLVAVLLLMGFFVPGGINSAFSAKYKSDEPLSILDKLSGAERERMLVEKARAEGTVTIYAIFRGKDAEEIVGAFKKKYPFMKVNHWGGRGSGIWQKITTEAAAGKLQVDVSIGGTTELVGALKEGLVRRYASPQRKYYSETFADPNGYWLGINIIGVIIAYNKTLLKGRTPPASYADLLKPEWKGDISLETEPDNLVTAMQLKWGKEKTVQYLDKLLKQKPRLRRGHTLQLQLLCAGEFAVSTELYHHSTARLIAKGCPVKIVYPKEFMAVIMDTMALLNNSPHPFAGALFFDWLASKEGWEVYRMRGGLPPRSDMDPIYPRFRGLLKKGGIIVLNPTALSKEMADSTWKIIQKYIQR